MEELINKALAFLRTRFDSLGEKIDHLSKKTESSADSVISALKEKKPDTASGVLSARLLSLSSDMKDLSDSLKAERKSSDTQEIKALGAKLDSVVRAIQEKNIPQPKEINIASVVNSLDSILEQFKMQKISFREERAEMAGQLRSVLEAIQKIKLEFPKEIKIEEQQFRALRSGGGMVVSGGGGVPSRMSATTVTQTNTSLTANTEASYAFPSNTVNFVIRLRDMSAKLYYAWATGTLPTSGTGALYFTAPQGFIRGQSDVEFSGRTIYIQSDKTTVAEIEVFRL